MSFRWSFVNMHVWSNIILQMGQNSPNIWEYKSLTLQYVTHCNMIIGYNIKLLQGRGGCTRINQMQIIQWAMTKSVTDHFNSPQGNQRWQTSPAAPPGGLGHCQTGMCMSNFMMIGWEMAEILHIEISWKHVSVTYDLDLWPKILLRNDWDITLWNFAKTRTNTQTHKQTWALQYLALPLWGAR